MIRLATDNDFNEYIAEGCRRRLPKVEIISIRDVGLGREKDPLVLEWAARTGHVLVTHDVSTMTAAAYERLHRGLPMAGLVIVPQALAVGEAVRRLVDLLGRGDGASLHRRVIYL